MTRKHALSFGVTGVVDVKALASEIATFAGNYDGTHATFADDLADALVASGVVESKAQVQADTLKAAAEEFSAGSDGPQSVSDVVTFLRVNARAAEYRD